MRARSIWDALLLGTPPLIVEDDVRPVRMVSGEERGFKLYLPGTPRCDPDRTHRALATVFPDHRLLAPGGPLTLHREHRDGDSPCRVVCAGPPDAWRRLAVVVPLSAVHRATKAGQSLMHVPAVAAIRRGGARYADMLAELATRRDVLLWCT